MRRSGGAAAHDACGAGRYLPLVGASFEGCAAGGAEREPAEAVLARRAFPASGGHAQDAGARLACGEDREGKTGCQRVFRGGRGWRGTLAGELAVDEALEPGGAGVVAAGLVDAGEGVLGDSQLGYWTCHRPPGRTGLSYSGRMYYRSLAGFAGRGRLRHLRSASWVCCCWLLLELTIGAQEPVNSGSIAEAGNRTEKGTVHLRWQDGLAVFLFICQDNRYADGLAPGCGPLAPADGEVVDRQPAVVFETRLYHLTFGFVCSGAGFVFGPRTSTIQRGFVFKLGHCPDREVDPRVCPRRCPSNC